MEYFDFDQATRDNDVAFDCSGLDDQELDFLENNDTRIAPSTDAVNAAREQDTSPSPNLDGPWPMHRAPEPCFFCRSMGLDCFVAQRGALQNGCTCCIALYRECSFTHAQPQERFLETLHVVGEDSYIHTGSLTGKKALKSYRGPSTSSLFEESEQRGRKSGSRFPKEAVKVLKSWLSDHTAHPYPTEQEKDELKAKTGLRRSQISNWLANARRRGKVRPSPRSISPALGGVPIPGKKLPPGVDLSDLNPLERWKHSPPENEAASPRDIIQAMATTTFHQNPSEASLGPGRSNSRRTGSSNGDSSFSNARPTKSVSNFSLDTTTQSSISDMSFASAFSHRSSRASFNSDTKDRRRRRHKSAIGHNPFHKARVARIYQCTFCTDSFPTKYDWQRHEKSLHLALEKWACAPQGGVITENGQSFCVFCQHLNPDEAHLELHNYPTCQEKSVQERTFYRKDHLNQHLRLMHNVKLGPWMDQWKSATTEVKSRCGFCSATFTTWKDRVDHLAAHFKSGAEMSKWKGDWGFEPCIQRCLEGAMPPYLIDEERKTLDPWVAQRSRAAGAKGVGAANPGASSTDIPVPTDANCFRRLEIELTEYIRRMTAQGVVPTDGMIQAEARHIIYGSDDPWDQTCADNPTWLAFLKRDAGIAHLPDSQDIGLGDLGMQPPFAASSLRQPPKHTLKTTPPLSNSFGFQSPAFPGSGVHSAAASHRHSLTGSLAGSLAGSIDFSLGGLALGGQTSTTMISALSSSAPVTGGSDPLIQMGFDAEFVQHFDNDYGDIGLDLDDAELDKFKSGSSAGFPASLFNDGAFNTATSTLGQSSHGINSFTASSLDTGYYTFNASAPFPGGGPVESRGYGQR